MGDLLASKFVYIKLTANFIVAVALMMGLGMLSSQSVNASSQSTIKFQGKVVSKSDGRNLIPSTPACVVAGALNDTCDFRVALYDAASGGTLLWREEHLNVEVGEYNGVFNLILNSVCASWPALGSPPAGCTASPTAAGIDWSAVGDVYIQVEFAPAGAASYTEVFSRKILTSVPFAQYAASAGSVGGITTSGLVQVQPAGGQNVNAATTDSLIWLNETGSATPNLLQLQVGGSDRFVVTNDGLVEIGNYSSDSWLSLAASSTGRSQINFATGVDPSAPNSGDLWWNGTALNFYDGSTTSNLLNVSKFTDAGTVTYLTATTDDFALGGSTLASSIFSVDVSAGDIFLGSSGTVDPSLVFENSSSQLANLDFTSTGNFNLTNAGLNVRLGINKAAPAEELDVVGDIQLTGDLLTDTAVTIDHPFLWADRENSGTGSAQVTGTATDSMGNVYVAGFFQTAAVDFGAGSWSPTGVDYFIVKYDSTGNFLWADRENGGAGNAVAYAITTDSDNNVYVVGDIHSGSVDLGAGSWTPTVQDYFIVKYDSAGNFLWADRENSGTGIVAALAVDTDSTGNVYVSGFFNGTVDLGAGSWAATGEDYYVIKYDKNGVFQWADRENGGTGNAQARSLTTDAIGNVYVAGYFGTAAIDFGAGSWTPSGEDYFLVKYSPSGVLLWADRENGGTGNAQARSVVTDAAGNAYLTGFFSTDSVDFGAGSWAPSGFDYFIVKYDSAGNFLWADRENSGTGSAQVTGTATDSMGNVYVAGFFQTAAVDFGAGSWSPTGVDYFIVKYDSTGNFLWADRENGGAGNAVAYAITTDSSGNVYVSGYFDTASVDFGAGSWSPSGVDYFIVMYGSETYTGSDIGTSSDPFANIYTVGILAQGAATFEDVINVSGNILAAAPTLNTGYTTTVDSTNNRGQWTDIAINNLGNPVITYRDVTASDARISVCSTVDCSGTVTSTSFDTASDTGNFGTAVAIRSNNMPVMAYYNATVNIGDGRMIDCTNVNCTAGNIREPNASAVVDSGRYPDVLINSDGFAYLSAIRSTTVTQNLQSVQCANLACSSFATVTGIDLVDNSRTSVSSMMRGNGLIYITYYDGTNGDLRLINCTDVNCTTVLATSLLTTNNVGQWSKAAVTKEGFPLIAHRNVTNQSVELVICKDFACGNFEQRVLVDTADNLGDLQLGLATKVDGSPVVSYYNTTNTSLYLYECHDPNCKTGTNHRLTNTDNRGQYSSIARKMGTNDEFTIAYYNATAGDLEVYNFAKSMSGGVSLGTASNYFKDLFVGKINTKLASISGFDVAEEYLVEDESIEAGEVVRFTGGNATTSAAVSTSNNSDAKLLIEKSQGAYDEGLIGVVSTEPGLYLSNWDKSEAEKKKTRPVALVGRVPVKVSSENGAIRRGDLLTSSEKYPGYAMKATRGGYVVGRSMEDFAGEETSTGTPDDNANNSQQVGSRKGVVSMYVDLGFVPDEYYEGKGDLGVEVESAGAGEGEELLQEKIYLDGMLSVLGKRAKFDVESLVVAGAMTVEGDLKVVGDIKTKVAQANGVVTDNLTINEGSKNLGEFVIPAGQQEVFVEVEGIKTTDVIFLSAKSQTRVTSGVIEPNKGFTVRNSQPSEDDIRGNYLLISIDSAQ